MPLPKIHRALVNVDLSLITKLSYKLEYVNVIYKVVFNLLNVLLKGIRQNLFLQD